MKLIIDRTKWNGGAEPNDSRLLDDDGKMCCLGFYCLAVGKTKDEILRVTMPDCLGNIRGLEKLVKISEEDAYPTETAQLLAHVNDAVGMHKLDIGRTDDWTLPQREAKITELFKQIDVEVEFIN